MKKRLFALACTIVMVIFLCACKNSGKTSTPETSVSSVSQTKSDTVTSTSKDENSPKIELDEVDFKRGLLNNQKYTNDTLDLTITLDDTWTIANEDQLVTGEYNMGDRVVPYTIRQVLYRSRNYFATVTYAGFYDADDLSFLDYFSKEK